MDVNAPLFLLIFGAAVACLGIALYSPPAALIVGGAGTVWLALQIQVDR